MEEIDNKKDQGAQILEKFSKCNVESDHESSDTSSSSVSEDEGSTLVSQNPNGTREKQSSPSHPSVMVYSWYSGQDAAPRV